MKLLIVDDEKLARDRLRSMVDELPAWEVAGEADNGGTALERVRDVQPDVLLLDIRMNGMDGLQVAREVARMAVPPAVIFTTAFSEHALSALEAGPAGYLLKPIRSERLSQALQRASRPSQAQLQDLQRMQESAPGRQYIVVNSHEGLTRVPLREVICFVADQKYTTVYHTHGQELSEESLRSLENDLAEWFVRIHRKTLVARHYMSQLVRGSGGQYYLEMRYLENPFPVSRRRLNQVRRLLAASE